MRMPALAGSVQARRGVARWGLRLIAAVSTGLLLVLAFPGPDLGPVAFVALIPLLLAVETVRPRHAAALGFVAGMVFFVLHIWWINVFGYLPLAALSLAQAVVLAGFAALVRRPGSSARGGCSPCRPAGPRWNWSARTPRWAASRGASSASPSTAAGRCCRWPAWSASTASPP